MPEQPPDLASFIPPGWQGKLPPCLIQVNEEGELSHDGAPLIHPGILELIYQSVHYEDGIYLLRIGQQSCQLEVADTFHVVRRAQAEAEGLLLTLNDGSRETLAPQTLRLGDNGVLYCQVRGGAFPARFGRQAYYQAAEHIEERGQGFALVLNGQEYPLAG